LKDKVREKFLLIANQPKSLLNFRGNLIRALINEGLEVHVVAPDLNSNTLRKQQLESLGAVTHEVSLMRTGMNPISDLRTIFQLWHLMLKIKPTYSLGYTHKPVIYGNLAAMIAGVPKRFALITGVGYTFLSKKSFLKKILQLMYRVALSNVEKVFFQNPDDEELFHTLKIIKYSDKKSVIVNGSGIDINKFKVAGLPKEIQFLMISRLLGDKGVREYFKACILLNRINKNIRFGFVGFFDDHPDAISEEELQHCIESCDLNFYGRLDDVRPPIAQSSVYVLPSYSEGTPRTVLEAMAMGRPIITTDAPGCKETVSDGDNGYIIPVKSVDELVAAMQKFVKKPELIISMGSRSRQIAVDKYDVIKVNNHMLSEMGINS
jgi:glycosyltransferase involved in cell wall biosynthesis